MSLDRIRTVVKGGWIIACLATFGVFLALSFYNCPASDDYTYARWMREWGFADAQITIYYAWGGRYFSNILLTLFNALSYSADYKRFLLPYQFHSVFHILFFVFSTVILFQRIRWVSSWWMALIPIAVFVQKANLISEFFYWMAGTVTYCSGYIFGALAVAAYLDLIRNKGKNPSKNSRATFLYSAGFLTIAAIVIAKLRWHKELIQFLNQYPHLFLVVFSAAVLFVFWYLWQSGKGFQSNPFITWPVLLFCLAGCAGSSELSGAILIVTFGFLWLAFANGNHLRSVAIHLPVVLSLIALIFNVFAPATANRQSTVDPALIHHWDQAFGTGWFILKQLIYLIPLFPIAFCLALLFKTHQAPTPERFAFHSMLAISYLGVIGFVLPVLTAYQSGELPLRAVNAHVLVMALTVFLLGYRFGGRSYPTLSDRRQLLFGKISFVLLLLFVADPGRNAIRTGIFDVFGGEASAFKDQYIQQQHEIARCKTDTCEVAPIRAQPASLCYLPNPVLLGKEFGTLQEYKTYSYARFYGKKFIFQK